jgi:hypothetical protein
MLQGQNGMASARPKRRAPDVCGATSRSDWTRRTIGRPMCAIRGRAIRLHHHAGEQRRGVAVSLRPIQLLPSAQSVELSGRSGERRPGPGRREDVLLRPGRKKQDLPRDILGYVPDILSLKHAMKMISVMLAIAALAAGLSFF